MVSYWPFLYYSAYCDRANCEGLEGVLQLLLDKKKIRVWSVLLPYIRERLDLHNVHCSCCIHGYIYLG